MSRKNRRNSPQAKPSLPQKPQASAGVQVPQQQQGSLAHLAVQHASWQGPLPPPAQLAQFDQVVPGCAERIVRMAEQEGSHSREVQMRAVRATVRLQHIGQGMAFVLAGSALYAAYQLAMAGHDWVAGSLVASGVVGIAAVFLNIVKNASAKD